MLKRRVAVTTATLLFLLAIPSFTSASTTIAGTTCKKLGATKVSKGRLYKCVKVSKKLRWDKGKLLIPAPTKSPEPSPIPTPEQSTVAPSPSPSAEAVSCPQNEDNASTSTPVSSGAENKNILVAQDNLWFHGTGPFSAFMTYDNSGTFVTPMTPALGFYDSSSIADNEKQIDMAADNGIDAFSQEWISPLGEGGSLEDPLDNAFLAAPNICRIRWAIFDDLNLRLTWKYPDKYGNASPNFDDPDVRAIFVSDMEHFADKYFGQAQYLKIDGRPIVEIWATWNFRGSLANIQSTVQAAREAVKKLGYDVYLVGDEEGAGTFNAQRVATWDATSSFIPMLMPGNPFSGRDNGASGLAKAITFVDQANQSWSRALSGLKVLGRNDAVSFQPGFSPQYDDTLFRNLNKIGGPTSLWAMSKAEIKAMAQVSLNSAQPVGASGRKLIWIGTWNNYPESTQVEATIAGSNYPGGNTGHDILDALQEVFGSQTFG